MNRINQMMNTEEKPKAHIPGTERIRAVLAAVFLSLVLTACGGGGGGNTGSGTEDSSEAGIPPGTDADVNDGGDTPGGDTTDGDTTDGDDTGGDTNGGGTGGGSAGGGGNAGGGGGTGGGSAGGGTGAGSGGGGGGVSSGGGTTTSVCGGNEYCIRIENGLNAAKTPTQLEAAWKEIQDQIDAAREAATKSGGYGEPLPTKNNPYLGLPVPMQQALADLYYQRQAALDPPPAKTPPAPPQAPPTAPATGSHTGSGPVASWGVWKSDQAAPGQGQNRFGVRALAEEGFYAAYEVTGEVTTNTASLPNGTATWEGDYEGIYQLGDENGVWGETTDDSGTASIEVDFTTMENAVTITLTSDTTDAKTLLGGSDSVGDEWTPTADLKVTTFDNDRVNAKPSADDDAYVKIAGAVFGQNGEALAGVYEFDYRKDHATITDGNNDPARVNDIRGAGWFGGCRDVTDFSCFGADPVTDPDPMDDPVPDPDPMDDPVPDPVPDPVTPPGSYSHLSFGAWGDAPQGFDAFSNANEFAAALQGTEYYYLKGTRTPQAYIESLGTSGTATWTGTYVGQYRTNPADSSGWGAFANDSGTVGIVWDMSQSDMAVTLTTTTGNNTFPGVDDPANPVVDTPKQSFVLQPNGVFSGGRAGVLNGGGHVQLEVGNTARATIDGAFFGPNAEEVGGVYNILQPGNTTGVQVEAVGVFGAGNKTETP